MLLYMHHFAAQQNFGGWQGICRDRSNSPLVSAFHKFAIVVFLGQFVAREKQEG